MAGGSGHQSVKFDPAVERWAAMRENVYQNFTFTRRASRTVFVLAALVPAAVAYTAWSLDEKYDWAGKQRGQSLLTKAPAPAPAPESE